MLWLSLLAYAAPRGPVNTDAGEVVVESQRPLDPPCANRLDRRGILAMPGRANEELLRAVPGMVATSARGFGGPWSYAWRGFDMGHGRDLAISLEDVPLNEPSQVWSPGMVDLTFIPRVLISGVDVCTGGAPAQDGMFGTAGAARLRLGLPREGVTVQFHAGTDGSGSLSAAWRPRRWDEGTWVAGEVDGGEGTNGYRTYRHFRLSGGVEGTAGPVDARGFVMLYDGLMDLPGFVREEDAERGEVPFYGGYREWQGELVQRRLLLSGRLVRPWRWGGVRLAAWVGGTGFRLRDNLTGSLDDPERGDAIELRQPGGSVGVKGTIQRVWEVMRDSSRLEAGVDLRAWFQTHRTTPIDARYHPIGALTERRQQPSALGLWAAGRIGLFHKGSLHAQIRLEQVDVRLLDVGADDLRGSAWVAAPQGGFVVTPVPGFQLFGRYARGYRPFDGRALDASGRQAIGWTDTVELGMDGLIAGLFRLELRGFGAWSRQEAVLDPWRGGVLSVGPVRRVGGEAKAVFVPVHAVRVELEGAAVDARDLDSRSPLPYVPPWSTAAGVYAEKRAIGPVTLAGGLRAWLAAPRRLNDGSLGKLAFGADLTARVGYRSWFFDLAADQVVPIQRVDAQSVFASDWGTGGGTTSHQISGSPFVLRLGFGVDL